MAQLIDFTALLVLTTTGSNSWTSGFVMKKRIRHSSKSAERKQPKRKWIKWIKLKWPKKKKLKWEQCAIISGIISSISKPLGRVWSSQLEPSLWRTSWWSRDTISEISLSDHMNLISHSASLLLRTHGIRCTMCQLFQKISNRKWFRTHLRQNLTHFISSEGN